MPQRRALGRFRCAFGRYVWLVSTVMAAAVLVVIGCMAASSTAGGTGQGFGNTKPANNSGGPLTRVGVPAAGDGYVYPSFSGNSRRFIAQKEGAMNGWVRVWDVSTLQPLGEPLSDAAPDYGLTYDGTVAFTTDDKSIRFWNVATSKLICATKVTDGKLNHVAISRDGTQFLSFAEGEQAVEVWRTGEARPRLVIKQHPVLAAFDPTGTRVAVLGRSTHIFSAQTGKEVCPPIVSPGLNLPHLAESFDSTGRWLLVEEIYGFKVVDTNTGQTRFHVAVDEFWSGRDDAKIVRWSSDNTKIVMASLSLRPARIYDAATGELECTLGKDVNDCWIGPGSHWAMGFRGALNDSLDVWDLQSGRRVQTLTLNNGLVSPDCSTILTMRDSGLGAIWRLQQD